MGKGRKPVEMIGKRFGRLTVERQHPVRDNTYVMYVCTCDCGETTIARGANLRNGAKKSYGCLKSEIGKWAKEKYPLAFKAEIKSKRRQRKEGS